MFALAYVILPFADTPPAEAIQASLSRFQRGGPADLPVEWLTFDDETSLLRGIWDATLTITQANGLRIEGNGDALWLLDTAKVQAEMRRRGLAQWRTRFADAMDFHAFADSFVQRGTRDPVTGAYGRWLNPLGRWDWWDLGGRFDGVIVGDPRRAAGRGVAAVSSGTSAGRTILGNLQGALEEALGQAPAAPFDVRSDRNVELVATLLADLRAGHAHAIPAALVLPPGAGGEAGDDARWLRDWPEPGPADACAALGLPRDAGWPAAVDAAYARFEDHWAAGVAYHL